jgi:tetratricopeptide (TPR) repeat protein
MARRARYFQFAVLLFAASCVAVSTPAVEAISPTPAIAAAPIATVGQSLFDRVVALNQIEEPTLDAEALRAAFQKLVASASNAVAAAETPEKKIAALNKVLLADRQVSYLSNKYWRDATLAASLLRAKGNCLSTSTLYVLVGEALKLPIRMVLVPRHAFVRWDDGATKINIETTHQGVKLPDSEYLQDAGAAPADVERLRWGASLDDKAFLAELTVVAAQHRVGENKLDAALELWTQAEALAPYRTDMALEHYQLLSDLTGRRSEARAKVEELLRGDLPPTVATHALMYLAADEAGKGDHDRERILLLAAYARAPKSSCEQVLTRLAFCLRALKDFRGAVRYMELAVVLIKPGDPELTTALYNLAILQKNDGRLPDALKAIREALKLNPESWNLQMLEAGYLVLNGQRDDGLAAFSKIQRPQAAVEFFDIMNAWFYAVSQQRDKFYPAFEQALAESQSTHILEWIDQDVDLDVYRNEAEFKALVEKHGIRLRGK